MCELLFLLSWKHYLKHKSFEFLWSLIYLFFSCLCFGATAYLRSHWLTRGGNDLCLCLLQSFTGLALTFGSDPFGVNFVCDGRQTPIPGTICWKDSSFSHSIGSAPWSKSTGHKCQGLVLFSWLYPISLLVKYHTVLNTGNLWTFLKLGSVNPVPKVHFQLFSVFFQNCSDYSGSLAFPLEF